jgi:hypothetical protein
MCPSLFAKKNVAARIVTYRLPTSCAPRSGIFERRRGLQVQSGRIQAGSDVVEDSDHYVCDVLKLWCGLAGSAHVL